MTSKSTRNSPARSGLVGATAVFGVLVLIGIAWMLYVGDVKHLGSTWVAWTQGAPADTGSGLDDLDRETRAQAARGAVAGHGMFPDSNHVRLGTTVFRFWGVQADDAAVLCQNNLIGWPCGTRASSALRLMTQTTDAVACFDRGTAANGERLGQCFRGDLDLGGELVENGLATEVSSVTENYHFSQGIAKAHGLGLWASNP